MKTTLNKIRTVLIGVLFIASVLVIFAGYAAIGSMTYSDGERTGTITKFSHKGILYRTWEGELSMGGFDQGGTLNVWQFSVTDPTVIEQLRDSQRKGGRWTLHYRQQLLKQFWKGSTSYFVVEVQKAE